MRKIFAFLCLSLLTVTVSAQTYHNGTWYSIYDDTEHVMNTQGDYAADGVFAPTAGQLNVHWGYEWIDWLGVARKINTQVLESADGGSATNKIGMLAENTANGSDTNESFNTSRNINWIKFNRPNDEGLNGPTHKVHVYHFDIPLAKHILLASGTYGTETASNDFGQVERNTVSAPFAVNFRSFLTDGDITITSSDPATFRIGTPENTEGVVYAVGANACASANGTAEAASGSSLGKIANYVFPIYFTPQKGGAFEATITITDGTSTATVTVTGTAPKSVQELIWPQEETEMLTIGSIAPAEASSGLEVTYTFAPEGIVSFAAGTFTILSDGVVTITASQKGDDTYEAAVPVSKTFTIYPAETKHTYSAEICEGGFYHDEHFGDLTEAGLYADTIRTVHGGDSVIHFTLVVHPLFYSEDTRTIKEGDQTVWQETELGSLPVGDTTLVAAFVSAFGCDSVYTLHLTVKPLVVTYGEDTIRACSGETVEYEGRTYRRTTNDSVVLPGRNYAGGDSIVALVVIFSQSFSAEAYMTISEGDAETWQEIDLSLFPTGDTTLVAEYQTTFGCDSTYTLYLTVEEKEENPKEDLPHTEADQIGVQKILLNGTLYIRKGDELFDLSGRKAR